MFEKLTSIGSAGLGLAFIVALFALPFIFIKGAMWASQYLLPPLIGVGWVAIAIIILLLLPLSLIPRLRNFTGATILISSYLFGLICWLSGLVITYALWGGWGVVIGLLLLGGGVVPVGMLASVFKGEWTMLLVLFTMLVLTFGTRIAGAYIAERGR